MAAAGSFAPARVRSDPGNKQPGQLQWRKRKGYWGSIGESTSREGELAVRPPMADSDSAPAREGRTSDLYRRGSALARRFTSQSRATSWHGRDMGTERRQRAAAYGGDAVGRAAEVGAARPVGGWRMAQVCGSTSVTHRSQRHDTRTEGRLHASACAYGDVRQRSTWNVGRRRARVRVPAQKQFRLA
jgi:hypothetical protein